MRFSHLVTLLSAGSVLAGVAVAQTAPKPAAAPAKAKGPAIGTYGFDTAGMDTTAKPGADFYDYANGNWDKTTTIPEDRASYGMFHRLQDLSLEQTRAILTDAARTPGSKIGDFYTSFMDEAGIAAKGIAPVKPWLAAIAAAPDKTALIREAGKLQTMAAGGMIGAGVAQDSKAPENYIVLIGQSGLSLPDRDYYLKDDAKLAGIRTAYVAYLTQLLTLAGEPNAAARANAVFELEKGLATSHWTRIQSRDADKTYNKWTYADLEAKAPGYPWATWFEAMGMPKQPAYIVRQPEAVIGEAKTFADAPLPVLKDYYTLRVLKTYASYLPKAFDDADFAFTGTVLSGTPQQQVRWKRAVSLVGAGIGEEVGKVYVARYFPPASKAAIDALVTNVRAAMGDRLRNLEWMAPETKEKALAKLAAFTPKIGYPTKWRDYSTLAIKRDDLVGNVARASQFEFRRGVAKLGQPIDRSEWFMTPMTINAYANPPMNEIVFPAAILQAPFFDPKADAAINYGGIGAVIGHELSHHFDDQGRKFDPSGKLAEWWTPQDVERFKTFTDKLVAQYDAYEPLPGQHVQGGLTLGENIADLAGLTVAYEAYRKSLNGKPAPVIGGLTGDQRFYLGWAQVWRTKYREPALRQQLLSDPHSPGQERVATVRNLDPFYSAFAPKPGEAMYLAPADRIRIW
ncbi:M13 family peptidase [Sphingomonas donggukensis]|uniref:M13 family peptidase n=1 Tax=Sphingomonas donggukensis TaxID=2949093 RepID=A0ABY4TW63_9SPHN|nr:M13-type metalloendopeptidase [Sphingomonas donggukensis]URW76643.1 M13 family peptidase [Sphingomonas donggukensis]